MNDTTDVAASNVVAKKDFIALKAEVDKVDVNELVNVPNG